MLSIRLKEPIVKQEKAVALNYDPQYFYINDQKQLTLNGGGEAPVLKLDAQCLYFNDQGQLSIKMIANSGLGKSDSGIEILHNDTLDIDGGALKVKLKQGGCLNDDSKGLFLNFNPETLEADENNYLTLKLDSNGCIASNTDGLQVNLDGNTLEADNNKITVKLDPDGSITVGNPAQGLKVNSDPKTIDVNKDKQLTVKVDPSGSLTAGDSGLKVNLDNHTITVNENKQLTVKLDSGSGLTPGEQGLQVNVDKKTIEVNSEKQLAAKIAPNGGITPGEEGLQLNVDNQSISVNQDKQLMVKLNPGSSLQNGSNGLEVGTDNLTIQTIKQKLSLKYAGNSGLGVTGGGLTLVLNNDSLAVDKSQLQVKIQSGSCLDSSNGLYLKYDDQTLTLDPDTHSLKVHLDSEGPIETSEDGGLTLRLNNTLEVDEEWELGVKLDEEGPLDYSAKGLTLALDDTMLVDQNETNQKYELGVNLSEDGPITATNKGLDLDFDSNTMTLIDGTVRDATVKQLAVHVKENSGITAEEGLAIKVQNPIKLDANGIGLNYSNNDFSVNQSGQLQLLKPVSLVYYYAEFGTPAMSKQAHCFPAGATTINTYYINPFVTLCGLTNIITGSVRMKLTKDSLPNNTYKLAFIVDPTQSISQSFELTKKFPDDASTQVKLRPSNFYLSHSIRYQDLLTKKFIPQEQLKWYNVSTFFPDCNIQKNTAEESFLSVSSILDDSSSNVALYFIMFLKTMPNTFWDSSSELYVLDIPFFYAGSILN